MSHDPDTDRDALVCDGIGAPSDVEAAFRRLDWPSPCYPVWRDIDGYGVRELVDRPASELTDAEILALPEPARSHVLLELGLEIEDGPAGLELVSRETA